MCSNYIVEIKLMSHCKDDQLKKVTILDITHNSVALFVFPLYIFNFLAYLTFFIQKNSRLKFLCGLSSSCILLISGVNGEVCDCSRTPPHTAC